MRGILRSALEGVDTGDSRFNSSQTSKPDLSPVPARIVVVGIGGAGNNTINRLATIGITGAELVAVNTEKMHLDTVKEAHKVLIGYEITRGFGSGGSVEIGRRAVEGAESRFRDIFDGADLIFITCGLGGGTGTGASPVIARIAKESGALVIGVVTMPFRVERKRSEVALEGLRELRENVNSVVIIDNNRLLGLAHGLPISYAFSMADEVLARMVKGITETITLPSLINLDFADVKAVMNTNGVVMVGVGESNAKDRAERVVEQALTCPLLGDIDYSSADGVLMHITGGPNVTISEATQIGELVRARVNPNAQVIMGARVDPSLGDTLRAILLINGARSPHLLGPASDGGVYASGGPSQTQARLPVNLDLDYL